MDQLEKLLRAMPEDADVPYMIAQEHAKAGEHAEAIEWYGRCLALDPGYHYAYFHCARSHEAMEDVDAAMAVLREGLARSRAAGDGKAMGEIAGYLDELEP